MKFQFHTGSIKSWGWKRSRTVVNRFNSILVRLKATFPISYCPCTPSFNSILVRLKVKWVSPLQYPCHVFQFHTGSIKSATDAPCSLKRQMRFNSILVRLKVFVCPSLFSFSLMFQFHTGSIKRDYYKSVAWTLNTSFNSILVRLKGGSSSGVWTL